MPERSEAKPEPASYARDLRAATLRYERLITELSLLRRIDQIEVLSTSMDDLCLNIVTAIAAQLPVENVSIMLLDGLRESLELRAVCSPAEDLGKKFGPGEWKGKRFHIGEGMVGRAAKTGEVVLARDVQKEAHFIALEGSSFETHSLMCLPLQDKGKTLGVLNIGNPEARFFEVEAEQLLEMVAQRIAGLLSMHGLHSKLRDSETRYRLVAEHAGDGILVFDLTGKVLSANPAVERITGVPAERLLSGELSWESSIWEEQRDEFAQYQLHVLERQAPGILRYRFLDAKGGTHLIEHRSSLIEDGAGIPLGIVAIVRDVTREAHLQRQLRQSQKMEAIGTLAGGIAHDFNNILSVILGGTELMLSDMVEEDPNFEMAETVFKAAERAKALVQQILSFSRQADVERRPTQVEPVVLESIKLLRSTIPATVDIVQEVAPGGSTVLANPTQIQQVVMNLCTNAYQAMGAVGGTLTVRVHPLDLRDTAVAQHPDLRPGTYVDLTVRDTGPGMDEATMERIFEPFFTTKTEGNGTGLGLSTVHSIATSLGGAIAVSSEPGQGAAFDVYLPAVSDLGQEEKEAPESVSVKGGDERILVVDDEENLLSVVRAMLEALGYRVTTHGSPTEALQAFLNNPTAFDLVITDQTMPKLTGVQLAIQILRSRPRMPIILITGYSEAVTPEDAAALGIRAYLAKPFTKSSLGGTIRRLLDENGSSAGKG